MTTPLQRRPTPEYNPFDRSIRTCQRLWRKATILSSLGRPDRFGSRMTEEFWDELDQQLHLPPRRISRSATSPDWPSPTGRVRQALSGRVSWWCRGCHVAYSSASALRPNIRHNRPNIRHNADWRRPGAPGCALANTWGQIDPDVGRRLPADSPVRCCRTWAVPWRQPTSAQRPTPQRTRCRACRELAGRPRNRLPEAFPRERVSGTELSAVLSRSAVQRKGDATPLRRWRTPPQEIRQWNCTASIGTGMQQRRRSDGQEIADKPVRGSARRTRGQLASSLAFSLALVGFGNRRPDEHEQQRFGGETVHESFLPSRSRPETPRIRPRSTLRNTAATAIQKKMIMKAFF